MKNDTMDYFVIGNFCHMHGGKRDSNRNYTNYRASISGCGSKRIGEGFTEEFGKESKIEYQSAQGDFGTAQLIAKSYVNSKKM